MTILWINLAFVYVASLLSRYASRKSDLGPTYIRPSMMFGFLAICALVLVSGLRNNIGDTYFYMHSYRTGSFFAEIANLNGDFGFNLLQAFLYSISSNPQLLIFTAALITNTLIVLVLYRYSRMIELAVFVYIASGMYTVSMNGIRQYLAAAILFAATHFILNGDWKKYIAVVLLAATIHKSALILIPIYFLVRREAWTGMTFLLLAAAVFLAVGFNQFSGMLFAAIENTQYGQYENFNEGGANLLRVVVNSVPVMIAFLGRHKLRELWPESDYIVNLALLGSVFMIIATQNWIFARFNIYFGLYNVILVSWVVKLFVTKSRSFIYASMLICYVIYFYYEQVLALNIDYGSDYISF